MRSFLGQADEEASVHAIGQAFSFGTLYDGDETDALRQHSGDDSDSDPYVAVIEAKADLRSFEVARASVTGLAQSAPAADAITDSLTMPQSDRAYFGTGAGSVQAFDLKSGALEQNLPNFNATSAEIFVVVLEKASGVQIAIESGSTSQNVAVAVGIHKIELGSGFTGNITNGKIKMPSSSARGYVLFGAAQELPSG